MSTVTQPVTDLEAVLDLDAVTIDPKWALKLPAAYAQRKKKLPLSRIEGQVVVAGLTSPEAAERKVIEKHLESECTYVQAEPGSLSRALDRVYSQIATPESASYKQSGNARQEGDCAVTICDELFQAAILRGASDIHLVPDERVLSVHLRVDGVLECYRELSKSIQPLVISRLKVMAGMDIAEKRSAQDGRIISHLGETGRKLEVRAASLPTRYGERLTLRLLSSNGSGLSLPSLGLRDPDLSKFESATRTPHGLILLTGPTGSGKSTTLYVAIQQLLNSYGGNVITIEDPIEYEIAGASQVEVDSADKVNFSKALRSILRHDPDVVMIGEIRDQETADTAIKAALTGHLVFSTLHTNTAAGVVTRLIDMGVEPFLVAATLRLSMAQRLVRRLCPSCRRERTITHQESLMLGNPSWEGMPTFDPAGCVACAGRGYAGRIGLFEVLDCSSEITKLIAGSVNEIELSEQARRQGGQTLLDDGFCKIVDGTTTIAELTSAVMMG